MIRAGQSAGVVASITPDTTKFEASLKPNPVMAMSTAHVVSLRTKTHGNVPSLATRFPI